MPSVSTLLSEPVQGVEAASLMQLEAWGPLVDVVNAGRESYKGQAKRLSVPGIGPDGGGASLHRGGAPMVHGRDQDSDGAPCMFLLIS